MTSSYLPSSEQVDDRVLFTLRHALPAPSAYHQIFEPVSRLLPHLIRRRPTPIYILFRSATGLQGTTLVHSPPAPGGDEW